MKIIDVVDMALWTLKSPKQIGTWIYREMIASRNPQTTESAITKKAEQLNVNAIDFFTLLTRNNIDASTPILQRTYLKPGSREEGGALSAYELFIVATLVRSKACEKIFEIGTYLGRTTLNLALNSKGTVYTLNLPQEDDGRFITHWNLGEYFVNTDYFRSGKIIQLYGDSRSFDFTAYYKKIDWMFIDGGHEYETVKNDTLNALRCVEENGMIVWHDFRSFTALGIMDALHEGWRDARKLYSITGTKLLALL